MIAQGWLLMLIKTVFSMYKLLFGVNGTVGTDKQGIT